MSVCFALIDFAGRLSEYFRVQKIIVDEFLLTIELITNENNEIHAVRKV